MTLVLVEVAKNIKNVVKINKKDLQKLAFIYASFCFYKKKKMQLIYISINLYKF